MSNPPVVVTPAALTITPETLTAYSGLGVTVLISGGVPPYSFFSSDQSIIGIAPTAGNLVAFIPSFVAIDTPVNLTIRDSAGASATAVVTVKPNTISNNVTITPVSSTCSPAVCSGDEALVTATLTQGASFLPGHQVKLEVISGDFAFVGIQGGPSPSIQALTDDSGRIQARILVSASAPNSTGIIQVTDLTNFAFRRASFTIAQASITASGFFVVPDTITFKGPRLNECASGGITAGVFVFGGLPPYTISNTSSAFNVSSTIVARNGDSFAVTPTGVCVDTPGAPIVVRDTAGRTATTLVANMQGTATNPTLDVQPRTVSVSCASAANVVVTGGSGSYFATPENSSIVAVRNGQGFTLTRRKSNPDSTVQVVISDSTSSVTVTANITDAATVCP